MSSTNWSVAEARSILHQLLRMDFPALYSFGRAREIPGLVEKCREEDDDSDERLYNLKEIPDLIEEYNRGKLRMEDATLSLAHLNGVPRDQISPIVTGMLAVTMSSASYSLTYTSAAYDNLRREYFG
jgi:hypothetical protein